MRHGRNVLAVNADTTVSRLPDNIVLSAMERLVDASARNQRVVSEQPDADSHLPEPDLDKRDG